MDATRTDAARLLGARRRVLTGERSCTPGGHVQEPPGPGSREELREIDAALARIADGTYGLCEVCGGPIGRDRLRALPAVRRCVGCSG